MSLAVAPVTCGLLGSFAMRLARSSCAAAAADVATINAAAASFHPCTIFSPSRVHRAARNHSRGAWAMVGLFSRYCGCRQLTRPDLAGRGVAAEPAGDGQARAVCEWRDDADAMVGRDHED